jgi:hypothetical protein
MKKVLFFCLLISIVSCKQTNEDKVWDAFLEYAKNNIDDPTGCEFVSVDSIEMLSTTDAKRQLTDMYNIYRLMTKKKDSLFSVLFNNYLQTEDENNPNFIKLEKVNLNNDKEFIELYRKIHQQTNQRIEFIKSTLVYAQKRDSIHSYNIEREYNGIMQSKDTTFYLQVLSYRTQDNIGKHLNKIYVTSDTLFNVSTFSNNKDALPSDYKQLWLNTLYFTKKYEKIFNMDNEEVETMMAMIYILENRYGLKVDF